MPLSESIGVKLGGTSAGTIQVKNINPDDAGQIDSMLDAGAYAAGPGAASGKIYFNADRAVEAAEKGEKVLLVRVETSPEDLRGMIAAEGILTARGGVSSHAALVARQMGKVCICGAAAVNEAGRLRMQTYKMALALVEGMSEDWDPARRTVTGTGVITAFVWPIFAEHAPGLTELSGPIFSPPHPVIGITAVLYLMVSLYVPTPRRLIFGVDKITTGTDGKAKGTTPLDVK